MQKRDPLFIRKVFVSHYCSIPFHLLDETANEHVRTRGVLPKIMIEELFAGAFHLIRNFELAPYASDTSLEDLVAEKIKKEEI